MERLISSPSSSLLPSRTAAIARLCLPLFHLAMAALGAFSNRPLLPCGGQTWATARLHTTVVINCTFPSNPNIRNSSDPPSTKISTHWIREWMAYHAHFLGPKSHFPGLPYPERLASLSLPSMPARCSPICDARHWSQRLDSAAAGCM